jgi:hypothetical protein
MPSKTGRHTFISYSRADKEFALKLALELRSSGLDIWLDQLDIPTGARWDDEVEQALKECEIFMVILTPASSASDNVKDEIGYAIDTGKYILPILLENADVPLRLRRFQYVDFTTKNYEEGVESAKHLLKKLGGETNITEEQGPASADEQAGEKFQPIESGKVLVKRKSGTKHLPLKRKSNFWLPVALGAGALAFLGIVAVVMVALFIFKPPLSGASEKNLPIQATAQENQSFIPTERQAGQPNFSELTPNSDVVSEATGTLPSAESSSKGFQFEDQYILLSDAGEWPLIESESFDVSDSAWLIFANKEDKFAKHTQRIENGKLLWGVEALSPDIWYWQVSPYFSYSNFYLSFKFNRNLGAKSKAFYGLIFRKQGKKYYLFRIDDEQRFAVQLLDNGDWTDLIGWTKASEIIPGQFNELTVIADGPAMTFFINKTYVGSVNNTAVDQGEIGFTVGVSEISPEILFEFDNFELRQKP